MIYELEAKDFERTRPVFTGLKNRVAISAIIEGNTPSRIFVDDPVEPTTAFMWNEFRYSYLAGDPDNDPFNQALNQLLTAELLPEAMDSPDPTVVLYPYPKSWQEKIGTLIGKLTPIELTRQTFIFNSAKFQHRDWKDNVPAGIRIQRIDEQLLAQRGQEIASTVQLFWRSIEDFLTRGLGFCLLKDEEVVSACFSAFAGDQKHEISVDTKPQYRRQGLATLTAAAFITHCLQNDLEPVWECWADNQPSVGLAKKLGFESGVDYPVYFINLEEA